MNKLKPQEVYTTQAEEGSGVYYDLQRMEDREQIEKQSLYCFTKEELASILAEAQGDGYAMGLSGVGLETAKQESVEYIINLFNDK